MASELKTKFENACNLVKTLPKKPDDDTLLYLYGLYKQSTIGLCNTDEPSGIFNIKEKKKWNAWKKMALIDKDQAMTLYIHAVNELFLNV